MSAALSKLIREELVQMDGVRKHAPTRRAMSLYTADSPSDTILFVDSGFVKIMRRGKDGKEVLVSIIPPGQIFGEHALSIGGPRVFSAEVMQEGVVYEIPRDLFVSFCESRPEMWRHLTDLLIGRGRELEQKISLLCLNDVESRILHYLGSLATVFGVSATNGEYSLPLSQSELASLIGATRETTSTTLNALARRGLIKLGRRLLVVSSAENLKSAANDRSAKAAQGSATL
jgi:CRP/FNR family transcriptional regulator